MSKSRDLSSYGTAALADTQTSTTDTTANALMAVGAFGLGTSAGPSITNLDTITVGGFYAYTNGATGAPIGDVGTVFHQAGVNAVSGSLRWTQFAISKSSGKSYTRTNDGGTILPWNEIITANADGNVGIGMNPAKLLDLQATDNLALRFYNGVTFKGGFEVVTTAGDMISGSAIDDLAIRSQADLLFSAGGSDEKMRLDSGGNLLLGATTENNWQTLTGFRARSSGSTTITRSVAPALYLNRLTSDGVIQGFLKDGTTVGSIGARTGTEAFISLGSSGLTASNTGTSSLLPTTGGTDYVDDVVDLGFSGGRFDNIYLTNAPIVTSDRNEKQDILEITTAETAVAKASKGLLRSFRLKSAINKKGEDARIHFGIIAQDLQDAFTAEGLDAGRYGVFMSDTWWETQTVIEAVEAVDEVTDEDGNVTTEAVEAKDAYTRTDTFDTLAEAPAGATERTRLGVRYSELLAFIIAAI
jgi:shikimate kinase